MVEVEEEPVKVAGLLEGFKDYTDMALFSTALVFEVDVVS